MNQQQRRLIIVTGLSGAGKTVVLHSLEDYSFYTIDNLPISLLDTFIAQLISPESKYPQDIAIGIDARNSPDELFQLPDILHSYRKESINIELVFIDASNEVLVKRFSETRRKHPLTSKDYSLNDAIKHERKIMNLFAEIAYFRIDTSRMLLHELRDLVRERIANHAIASLSLQIMSFGFKHGIPADADFVYDLRCLPNPFWKKNLRHFSGKDQPVIDFLSSQESVKKMQEDLLEFFKYWITQFEKDNRSYLSIALGCTGGHHRSVYMAEQLASAFIYEDKQVIIRHRDI